MSNNHPAKKEKLRQEYVVNEKLNNITNSRHVENQNQEHNVKKEVLGPNTKR